MESSPHFVFRLQVCTDLQIIKERAIECNSNAFTEVLLWIYTDILNYPKCSDDFAQLTAFETVIPSLHIYVNEFNNAKECQLKALPVSLALQASAESNKFATNTLFETEQLFLHLCQDVLDNSHSVILLGLDHNILVNRPQPTTSKLFQYRCRLIKACNSLPTLRNSSLINNTNMFIVAPLQEVSIIQMYSMKAVMGAELNMSRSVLYLASTSPVEKKHDNTTYLPSISTHTPSNATLAPVPLTSFLSAASAPVMSPSLSSEAVVNAHVSASSPLSLGELLYSFLDLDDYRGAWENPNTTSYVAQPYYNPTEGYSEDIAQLNGVFDMNTRTVLLPFAPFDEIKVEVSLLTTASVEEPVVQENTHTDFDMMSLLIGRFGGVDESNSTSEPVTKDVDVKTKIEMSNRDQPESEDEFEIV